MATLAASRSAGSEDFEEPPGRRGAKALKAAQRAFQLRYDRLATWIALLNAGVWIFLLARQLLIPAESADLLPIDNALRAIAASSSAALVFAGLISLALIDVVVGVALYRGIRRAPVAARIRAVVGLALCVLYYIPTRDFWGAFLLASFQGVILALLTRSAGVILIYPSMIWLVVFFVVPLLSILAFSLGRGTAIGTVDLTNLSTINYERILRPVGNSGLVYVTVVLRTVWIAFLTTIFCLLIGYPFAYWMAKQPERRRNALMMLVMIPFWTNILIRTYAWLIILRDNGLLNTFLKDVLGVIDKPLELVNTPGALLLGLVYGYLPYMILPLYTAIEKLDTRLVEAANDLYAAPNQAFRRVVLPLTMPGIIAGSILVFIPSVGTYVVSNLLGGGKIFLIGNLLEQQFTGSTGNKAFGAAFGVVLTVLMLFATMVYFRIGRKESLA